MINNYLNIYIDWFEVDEEHNTKVYVSNLPLNITEQEFIDLMQKCGLIMKDIDSGQMKIKLYTERGTDILKGDALCTYIKVLLLFVYYYCHKKCLIGIFIMSFF